MRPHATPKHPITLVCSDCGNPFAAFPSEHHRRFCSRFCYLASCDKAFMARLIAKREIAAETGCWLWTGATIGDGYGFLNYQGERWRLNRLAFYLWHGVRPGPDDVVCHNCPGGDNPRCFNPDHLFLSDTLGNARDMVEKGRSLQGSRNPNARLNEDQIREIRARYANGEAQYRLAREFGTDNALIHSIVHRKSWKHVA